MAENTGIKGRAALWYLLLVPQTLDSSVAQGIMHGNYLVGIIQADT